MLEDFPVNSFYAVSPLQVPYSFHNDQHRAVHCSTFWTYSKSLEDGLALETEEYATHARAITGMAKGNDVEALTMEQAYTRLKRSKDAGEKNGLLVTLLFFGLSTKQDVKTYVVFPELGTKLVVHSGDFLSLHLQLDWGVALEGDPQPSAIADTDCNMTLNFCVWDIGANTVPAPPPELGLPRYRTNYELFPGTNKTKKRKAARKKAKDSQRESAHASTSAPAPKSMPANEEDELD